MLRFLSQIGLLLLLLIAIIGIIYYFGPKPPKPDMHVTIPIVATDLSELERNINEKERNVPNIRKDNEARIVWADASKKIKTPYSLVYLPGFSACQFEGEPMHRDFAKRYGCNLYLARLYGHGTDEKDNLLTLTPENYLASAEEAIAIGQQLGEKVIVMSTSTGGTLSLQIASQLPDIAGLILYSPNIAIADPNAALLNDPWGLQISRLIKGSDFHEFPASHVDKFTKQYWTWRYRLEALVNLENLMENTMLPATFNTIKCPIFLGYYYKNEKEQDATVSVAAMRTMFAQLGTPALQKRELAFPAAGTHVIACKLRSKAFEEIQVATFKFADEILKLKPVL
jgi:pimeloyl-ACP methyl ester carboxylesterase